jgi:hypothetical protein
VCIEQKPHDLRASLGGSDVQRCKPVPVDRVHLSAAADQQLCGLNVAQMRGPVQCSRAIRAGRINVGATVDECACRGRVLMTDSLGQLEASGLSFGPGKFVWL